MTTEAERIRNFERRLREEDYILLDRPVYQERLTHPTCPCGEECPYCKITRRKPLAGGR